MGNCCVGFFKQVGEVEEIIEEMLKSGTEVVRILQRITEEVKVYLEALSTTGVDVTNALNDLERISTSFNINSALIAALASIAIPADFADIGKVFLKDDVINCLEVAQGICDILIKAGVNAPGLTETNKDLQRIIAFVEANPEPQATTLKMH